MRSIVFLFLLAGVGEAAVFSRGDLLVGGRPAYPFEGFDAYVENYGASGTFQRHAAIIDGGHPRDMIMLGSDVLIADEGPLTRLSEDGTFRPIPFLFFPKLPARIAADARGNIYVGELLGVARVYKVTSSGDVLARFDVPREVASITALDLDIDQCTLFYASGGSNVQRYDVCTNAPMANFARVSGNPVTSIRVLSNRNVLVASALSGLTLFDPAGNVVRTFLTNESVLSLAILPDEGSVWASITSSPLGSRTELIERVDLRTGAIIAGPTAIQIPGRPLFTGEALIVVGSLRAAQRIEGIPALSPFFAVLLVFATMVVGCWRLRQ
jgi:hypothetical protein